MLGVLLNEGMPALSVLLADHGGFSAARLAKSFGVNRSTAHRWIKDDDAPRAVLLALYLSAPGFGYVRAYNAIQHAEHGRRLALDYVDCMKREVAAVQRELARVLAVGDFGSANLPSFTAPTAAELMAQRGTGHA